MFVSPALNSARKKWFDFDDFWRNDLILMTPVVKTTDQEAPPPLLVAILRFEAMFPAAAFFPVRTRGWDLTVQFTVRDCSWVTHAPGLTPGYKMRPLHAMLVPKSYPASSTRTNKDYLHFRCIFYDRWQDFKITRGIHHNLLSFLYISYILKVILEKRKPGDLKRETNEPLVWLRCWKGKTSSLRTLDSIVTG